LPCLPRPTPITARLSQSEHLFYVQYLICLKYPTLTDRSGATSSSGLLALVLHFGRRRLEAWSSSDGESSEVEPGQAGLSSPRRSPTGAGSPTPRVHR
jgi:hypothetical protein